MARGEVWGCAVMKKPGCDQRFLSDFGKIFPFLQSIFHGEFWGRFTLLGWQLTGSALALSGTLAPNPVAKGAISCLSWQSLWPFGGHRPPLSAILCGHIWPFLALFNMGYGQNWPSANNYSQNR
jgi:hypothetical protein